MSSPALQRYPANLADRNKPRFTPAVLKTAIAIGLLVFSVQWMLALQLNSHDNLRMLNRFFDADNAWYLINFESGNQTFGSYGGRNAVHPNVANFVHPFVLLTSNLVSLVSHKSKAELATDVSLTVGPVFAGIRSAVLFVALTTAGFSFVDALLATALGSLAFSSVIFGCLPESFVISGAFFAGYFLLVAWTVTERKVRYGWWVLSGMLLSSITITNLMPFAIGLLILLLFVLKDKTPLRSTVFITGASLVATVACFLVLTAAHGSFRGIGRRVGQLEEVRYSTQSMLVNFPRTLALTLVGVRPSQMIGSDEEGRSAQIQVVRFTFRHDLDLIKDAVPTITGYQEFGGNPVLEFSVLGLMLGGVAVSSMVMKTQLNSIKALFILSLAHLASHWLLHSFFGLELFLYSQHWIIPLVIAVCCGLALPGYYKWIARGVVLTLTIAAAYQTATVMQVLIRQ